MLLIGGQNVWLVGTFRLTLFAFTFIKRRRQWHIGTVHTAITGLQGKEKEEFFLQAGYCR